MNLKAYVMICKDQSIATAVAFLTIVSKSRDPAERLLERLVMILRCSSYVRGGQHRELGSRRSAREAGPPPGGKQALSPVLVWTEGLVFTR